MGLLRVNNTAEYHRAKVLSVDLLPLSTDSRVRLYFIDFGNVVEDYIRNLRLVPERLLNLPPLAMECYLTGVGPSLFKDPNGKWTQSAKEWFIRRTANQQLPARRFLEAESLATQQIEEPKPNGNYRSHELEGPYSPLEMRMFGKVHALSGSILNIEADSVNSVLLDDHPALSTNFSGEDGCHAAPERSPCGHGSRGI
ncbi:hypothetical protein OUZ56_009352 [Daphnia magna]|uniref:Tudor domain-containing protein n=1 Tax=Daphnia magna TaxID=35525 RepID=A0ABR0AFR0_9CRUS|nr:hypothetical protein OUZ56_009352 [Daphnia magna]